jgi:radical SAM protein with 4Fe4S-binding SPASM domain
MKLSDVVAFPKWVVIQLIEKCNLRCKMCYEWGETGAYSQKESLSALDFSVLERVIKDCLPAKPFFEFFGGEPLLYPQVWEAIRLIREGGCELAFPTNGTTLEKHAELLVETQPNRLWISLDGPEEINDRQRGKGVFQKVIRGIDKLYEVRSARNSEFPKIGITYVVTPLNYAYIEEFFLRSIDLCQLDHLSIECQSYASEEQYQRYAEILKSEFGIHSTPCAKGYVQDLSRFAAMDFEVITQQMARIKSVCEEREIRFVAQPKTIEGENIRNYWTANWDKMVDRRSRCAFPWIYAEISARGDVTTCHSFYDLSLGNVYRANILDVWNGEQMEKLRNYLRKKLFPICTSCCRYYTSGHI